MKGYKAFKKGLICEPRPERRKQYEENTVFTESDADICTTGMHFCKNPFDCLNDYPLMDNNCDFTEFAEVAALGEVKTDDDKKFYTKKLKVESKISLGAFLEAGIDFLLKPTKIEKSNTAQIGSSGYAAKIGSSGYAAQIGSSGYAAKIGSSGEYAQIGSIGYAAQIGSSGYDAKIGSSGSDAQIGSSGNYAKIGSSGYAAQIGSSGSAAQIGSSGYDAKIGSSGSDAQIGSSGNYAKIGSSGNDAKINVRGENAVVAAIGEDGKLKGVCGTWITLAEYDAGVCVCVKSAQIDGELLKADTWYELKNGEFAEV